jgi:SAM-dependent methyltransferase
MIELIKAIAEAVRDESLHLIVLSRPRSKESAAPSRVSIRPVTIGGRLLYQAARRIGAQEIHENIEPDNLGAVVTEWVKLAFDQANAFTTDADVEFRRKRGKATVRTSAATHKASNREHNKTRQYIVPDNRPCPFLIATGIMSKGGKVRSSRQKKFRQINRYLDIVNDIVKHLPVDREIRVVDFGCGRSYLTFALHHLFTNVLNRKVQIIGLDLKTTVIEDCQRLAAELDCKGLTFQQGDIASHSTDKPVDLCVSLHACDTATDEAIGKAIRWQSSVILAVPCCHHELASQIRNPNHDALLRYGIMRERYAAIATDSLRAKGLDALGYRTQVIEFIDTEHTPKNLMIRAVKRTANNTSDEALSEYQRFRESLGIQKFHLESATDLLGSG